MIWKPLARALLSTLPIALLATASASAQSSTPPLGNGMDAVGATSRTAPDHIAIEELSFLFDNALDEGDIDTHMDTWADEMRFESPFGSYTSKADYREWVEEFHRSAQGYGGTRHMVINNVIAVNGDRATQTCYQVILGRTSGDGAPSLLASARMEDELVRTPDGWRFSGRTLHLDQDPARFQD